MARLKAILKVRNAEGIREDHVVDNFSDKITEKVKYLEEQGYKEIIIPSHDRRRR